ncbi:uncharacterized protein I303_101588 [Kwoniella dejecticola CBS 10117]|uniref:Uncharacterized protein n=1 Tax=Kwoniella dejecticola CBS 10117 TaxID=1296121 RepID=A0A1A6ADC1_9TREE|nr:uncharacterized protein I303_02280 [Kwoniella dejecticola CBS 10117]OBR88061.1 hypothetical protein I303_02280 [Kwoniella dejecticola CBS 10117]
MYYPDESTSQLPRPYSPTKSALTKEGSVTSVQSLLNAPIERKRDLLALEIAKKEQRLREWQEGSRYIELTFKNRDLTIESLTQSIRADEREAEVVELKKQVINFQAEIEVLKRETLNDQHKSWSTKSASELGGEVLKTRIEELERQIDRYETKIRTLESTSGEQKTVIDDLKSEKSRLGDDNDTLLAREVEVKIQRDDLQTKLDVLKRENGKYQKVISGLKRDITQLENDKEEYEINTRVTTSEGNKRVNDLIKPKERATSKRLKGDNRQNEKAQSQSSTPTLEGDDEASEDGELRRLVIIYKDDNERLAKQLVDLRLALGVDGGNLSQFDISEDIKKKMMMAQIVSNRDDRLLYLKRGIELSLHKKTIKSQMTKIKSLENAHEVHKITETRLRHRLRKYEGNDQHVSKKSKVEHRQSY